MNSVQRNGVRYAKMGVIAGIIAGIIAAIISAVTGADVLRTALGTVGGTFSGVLVIGTLVHSAFDAYFASRAR